MEENIELSHLPEVDEIDRAKINASLQGSYGKLQKRLNNKILLRAHFKEESKTGARKRHEVHLHLSAPGVEVTAVGAGWNLITALQGAIETLERETSKKVND